MIENVTAIMVCYNTRNLVKRAYESVRHVYPDMPFIIVDNSNRDNTCAAYVDSLKSEKTAVITPGQNIGHGPGMNLGINYAKTQYALIFDSDIVFLADCVPAMLEKMGDDTFGIGRVDHVNVNGNNKARSKNKIISYLHPYFHIINIANYKNYRPYVDHGAPCIYTMHDIAKRGLSDKVLINFLGIDRCVRHGGRGTRNILTNRISRRRISRRRMSRR